MFRYAFPAPTAPGKTAADIKSIPAYIQANLTNYKESRKRLGITVERVYLQATPMGNVVIAYNESQRGFGEVARALGTSDLEVDRKFVALLAEVHGIDLRKPPVGAPPETIGEWVDPQVTTRRKGLAFIAPLLPGKIEAGKAFMREAFVSRQAELTDSRRALGQNVEVVTLSSNPMGDFICVYLEGHDPVKGNQSFAASTRPYDVWFKDRLRLLFPAEVDFSKPLPPIEQIFDYVAVPVTA